MTSADSSLWHPIRLGIIETLGRAEKPLSPAEVQRGLSSWVVLSVVVYHLKVLEEAGVLRKAGQRRIRGVSRTFYALRAGQGESKLPG